MRRIISALFFCVSSWASAQNAPSIELAPNAPDRHIVVPGDTLWGVASQFLKDPYRWPEIWRLNPDQIKNPHLIYPGQVVILDKSGDRPLLKLGTLVKASPRIYIDGEKKAIPAIPQHVIEPFLAQPLVVEPGQLERAARIVGIREGRVNAGPGETIFGTQINSKWTQWQVFRPGKLLRDPDLVDPDKPGEVLGAEAIFLGTARLVRGGEPATLEIVSAREEIARNDYLLPTPTTDIVSYVPHAPEKQVRGRIVGLYAGVGEGGRFSVVSVSRGRNDGLEIGHVLAIERAGHALVNRDVDGKKEVFDVPDERYGVLFVFRVFDRVSYGLVMEASRSVVAGDIVRTP